MFNRDRWREIFDTISKNKLRTFLSGFTVALGIFIFIILFGLGNGLKNSFQEFFLDDASNAIFPYPGKTSMPYKGFKENRRIEFDIEDVEDIKNKTKTLTEASMKLGEAVYKDMQQQEEPKKEEKKKDDNTIDADFKDVTPEVDNKE